MGLGLWVKGLGFTALGLKMLRFVFKGLGFRVVGLGLWVKGLGFTALGLKMLRFLRV